MSFRGVEQSETTRNPLVPGELHVARRWSLLGMTLHLENLWFVTWRSRCARSARDQRCPSCRFARAQEVNSAVSAPDDRDAQRKQWFHLRPVTHERADEVKRHARQIGQQPK